MFEIREFPLSDSHISVVMAEIDGIPAPAALVDEAQGLANSNKKVWFIGVIERLNPHYREADANTRQPWTGIIEGARIMNMRGRKYELTGKWIISNDRDAILAHGCGRLIWITPRHDKTVHERLTRLHDVVTADASGRTAYSLMNECASTMYELASKINALMSEGDYTDTGRVLALADALALKARELEHVAREVGG